MKKEELTESEETTEEKSTEKDSDIIDRATKNHKRIEKQLTETHELGKRCKRFAAGKQWEPKYSKSREDTGRPMITINKLAVFSNNVVNKMAMQRVKMKVRPFEKTDAGSTRVVNGLLTHIQYASTSRAAEAYLQSFQDTVESGLGYIRVATEYCDEMSTDQEIVILPIDNPFSVFLDPERNFCVIIHSYSPEVFKEKYGKKPAENDNDSCFSQYKKNEDDIIVIEYWELEKIPTTIYKIQLPDSVEALRTDIENAPGGAKTIDQAVNALDQENSEDGKPGKIITIDESELDDYEVYEILTYRKSHKKKVTQYILSGDKVLEKNEWNGRYIPIVPSYGRKYTIDDTDLYKPLVADAIDPQILYNFYRSEEAELLQRTNRAQWLGAAGQFTGHEDEFENPERPLPYLEYEPVEFNGKLVPPPQQLPPPQPSAGLIQSMMQSSDEIKATMGLFDASLGNTSNEQSGKAIYARAQQGDVSTYHYTLAHHRQLRELCIICVDLIPTVYDTVRTVQILGDDMKDEIVLLNKRYINEQGESVLYDMNLGRYDVVVDVGEPYTTLLMESAASMMELVKAVPAAGPLLSDLIIKTGDSEFSEEAAKRVRAGLIPQGLFDKMKQMETEDKTGKKQDPRLIQLNQQMQVIVGKLNEATGLIKQLKQENFRLTLQAQKNTIEPAKIKADAEIKKAQIAASADIQQEQIKSRARLIETGRNPQVQFVTG